MRLNVDQALVLVLADHADGDTVRYSDVFPALRARGLSVKRTTEVLDRIGVFADDRTPSFDLWLASKLDGLAAGIAHDVEDWARHVATVWNYLNRIRPVLLEWSNRYDHLREVTRADVLAHLDTVHGSQRQATIIALRSLFQRARKNGTIFKEPDQPHPRRPARGRRHPAPGARAHQRFRRRRPPPRRPADPRPRGSPRRPARVDPPPPAR
ncbi:hypothetical protein [Streptomyces inusitatus]|nr:hypothetical protein [Streptomyces inusitatus]